MNNLQNLAYLLGGEDSTEVQSETPVTTQNDDSRIYWIVSGVIVLIIVILLVVWYMGIFDSKTDPTPTPEIIMVTITPTTISSTPTPTIRMRNISTTPTPTSFITSPPSPTPTVSTKTREELLYEETVKFVNFQIPVTEQFANDPNKGKSSPAIPVPVQPQPAPVQPQPASTLPPSQPAPTLSADTLKRQEEEQKMINTLYNILFSDKPFVYKGITFQPLKKLVKEIMGKDPWICKSPVPRDPNIVLRVANNVIAQPFIKAYKESNPVLLELTSLLALKMITGFGILIPGLLLDYNGANKTFRLTVNGKLMKLSELTNPELRELNIIPTTVPTFIPLDLDREKTRLLPHTIKMIQVSREYYNRHPEIATRLPTYKTNQTTDIPLQAFQDGFLMKMLNGPLQYSHLNELNENKSCDTPMPRLEDI
jgi:hypothetical protein